MTTDFAERLLAWFERHGRHDLPWQQDPTAYRVWVSEIMLQQTQVATVIPYFERFMRRFPDVEALAAAPLDDVLHHWSGLGYYARARNLHSAARQLVDAHGGAFPDDLTAMQRLPGVGRSTAAAILSLARGQRQTILDGNVKRVLARHAGIDGWPGGAAVAARLWAVAEGLTPHTAVAAYNQAMMDLGATLCVRSRPRCGDCPVAADCVARRDGTQHALPGRRPRRTLPERSVHLLLVREPGGAVLLERRPPTGVWGGLWSLPELVQGGDPLRWCTDELGHAGLLGRRLPPRRHSFTHFHLDIEPLEILLDAPGCAVLEPDRRLWYKPGEPESLGLAAPVARLLAELGEPIR